MCIISQIEKQITNERWALIWAGDNMYESYSFYDPTCGSLDYHKRA